MQIKLSWHALQLEGQISHALFVKFEKVPSGQVLTQSTPISYNPFGQNLLLIKIFVKMKYWECKGEEEPSREGMYTFIERVKV